MQIRRLPSLFSTYKTPQPADFQCLTPMEGNRIHDASEASADAVMATNNNQTLRDELASYNQDLEACLMERAGMSLKTFKTIKALTQLIGAGAGAYAMSKGAPPGFMMVCITAVVSGPEILEYLIEQQGNGTDE